MDSTSNNKAGYGGDAPAHQATPQHDQTRSLNIATKNTVSHMKADSGSVTITATITTTTATVGGLYGTTQHFADPHQNLQQQGLASATAAGAAPQAATTSSTSPSAGGGGSSTGGVAPSMPSTSSSATTTTPTVTTTTPTNTTNTMTATTNSSATTVHGNEAVGRAFIAAATMDYAHGPSAVIISAIPQQQQAHAEVDGMAGTGEKALALSPDGGGKGAVQQQQQEAAIVGGPMYPQNTCIDQERFLQLQRDQLLRMCQPELSVFTGNQRRLQLAAAASNSSNSAHTNNTVSERWGAHVTSSALPAVGGDGLPSQSHINDDALRALPLLNIEELLGPVQLPSTILHNGGLSSPSLRYGITNNDGLSMAGSSSLGSRSQQSQQQHGRARGRDGNRASHTSSSPLPTNSSGGSGGSTSIGSMAPAISGSASHPAGGPLAHTPSNATNTTGTNTADNSSGNNIGGLSTISTGTIAVTGSGVADTGTPSSVLGGGSNGSNNNDPPPAHADRRKSKSSNNTNTNSNTNNHTSVSPISHKSQGHSQGNSSQSLMMSRGAGGVAATDDQLSFIRTVESFRQYFTKADAALQLRRAHFSSLSDHHKQLLGFESDERIFAPYAVGIRENQKFLLGICKGAKKLFKSYWPGTPLPKYFDQPEFVCLPGELNDSSDDEDAYGSSAAPAAQPPPQYPTANGMSCAMGGESPPDAVEYEVGSAEEDGTQAPSSLVGAPVGRPPAYRSHSESIPHMSNSGASLGNSVGANQNNHSNSGFHPGPHRNSNTGSYETTGTGSTTDMGKASVDTAPPGSNSGGGSNSDINGGAAQTSNSIYAAVHPLAGLMANSEDGSPSSPLGPLGTCTAPPPYLQRTNSPATTESPTKATTTEGSNNATPTAASAAAAGTLSPRTRYKQEALERQRKVAAMGAGGGDGRTTATYKTEAPDGWVHSASGTANDGVALNTSDNSVSTDYTAFSLPVGDAGIHGAMSAGEDGSRTISQQLNNSNESGVSATQPLHQDDSHQPSSLRPRHIPTANSSSHSNPHSSNATGRSSGNGSAATPYLAYSLEDITPSTSDSEKVFSTLRQCVRDWSDGGADERLNVYGIIISTLERLIPRLEDRQRSQVLIPGAGLSRLSVELAMRGFNAFGNEFSYHMLIAGHFLMNHMRRSGQYVVYPFVDTTLNLIRRSDQLASVFIPDLCTTERSSEINLGSLAMIAGDFLEVYSRETEAGQWDCVASCFFIDTAHNVLDYLTCIYRLLRPGGYFINLGPLLYHFADSFTETSIELSLDEVLHAAGAIGFVMTEEPAHMRATTYTNNTLSMKQMVYNSVFFVLQKPYGSDVPN